MALPRDNNAVTLHSEFHNIIIIIIIGERGGEVDWGTVIQAGKSRVRFPMVSVEFFNDIILPAAHVP